MKRITKTIVNQKQQLIGLLLAFEAALKEEVVKVVFTIASISLHAVQIVTANKLFPKLFS